MRIAFPPPPSTRAPLIEISRIRLDSISMNPALAVVLSNPAIWRGGDCAPEPAALPSGFPELDAVLPGRGWPGAALTEIVLGREGIGEIRLTLPALARLQAHGRDVVWIAPPHLPYAPALAAAGLDLARLLLVRCRSPADQLWAYEQALRAPECGAAFAWLGTHDDRVMRRLAVAAREGRTWGVLWRRPGQRAVAAVASLRLALVARERRLAVHVLKRRGGELAQPVFVDVDGSESGPWSRPGLSAAADDPGVPQVDPIPISRAPTRS
jgi:hypothetical protein